MRVYFREIAAGDIVKISMEANRSLPKGVNAKIGIEMPQDGGTDRGQFMVRLFDEAGERAVGALLHIAGQEQIKLEIDKIIN